MSSTRKDKLKDAMTEFQGSRYTQHQTLSKDRKPIPIRKRRAPSSLLKRLKRAQKKLAE